MFYGGKVELFIVFQVLAQFLIKIFLHRFCIHFSSFLNHFFQFTRIQLFTCKHPTQTGGVACDGPITNGASLNTTSPGLMFLVAT
jgi:hypothetical protein